MAKAKRSRLLPTGECWCGCGSETTRDGSFFLPGHDRYAEAAVIRLRYDGKVARFIVEHGFGPGGSNLRREDSKADKTGQR
jgi:hypothetical protein